MDLENIISIAGYSGLHKVVGSTKNGIVVESLEDGKRMAAYASHKVSALEDISIYTETEDVPLKDVFQKIYDLTKGKAEVNHKSSANELKDFFVKALPGYDEDRVYVSDIKKVVRWFNILSEAGLLTPKKEEKEEKPKAKAKTKAKAKKTDGEKSETKPKSKAKSE